jgi:hypothetical protein
MLDAFAEGRLESCDLAPQSDDWHSWLDWCWHESGARFEHQPAQAVAQPIRRRTRRPSITAELKAARRAGASSATVTRPDGSAVTASFAEPVTASDNPWLADIKATRQ